jgi:hypothetical protein
MPTLEDVSFETASFSYRGERDGVQVWLTPAEDPVGLFLFPIPPDIGADVSDLRALREFYRSSHAAVGTVVIALDAVDVDGCRSVRLITKIPQQPSGMTYIGSLTIPFRDFSFVLKVEAREHGTTGIRDTLVANELMDAGIVTIDVEAGDLRGWTQDPYDATLRDGPYPNLSESEAYDTRFPDHPLSRVRPLLRHLSQSVTVSDRVRTSPPFVYPVITRSPPWWSFWWDRARRLTSAEAV